MNTNYKIKKEHFYKVPTFKQLEQTGKFVVLFKNREGIYQASGFSSRAALKGFDPGYIPPGCTLARVR